jgi:hypothetical protein
MANFTSLLFEVESLKAAVALQQEQIGAVQATSDNVWILGRAFTVLTMVSLLRAQPEVSELLSFCQHHVTFSCTASWVCRHVVESIWSYCLRHTVIFNGHSLLLQICHA